MFVFGVTSSYSFISLGLVFVSVQDVLLFLRHRQQLELFN